ncbi:uncharacterized protein [Dysidea avara]
MAEEKVTNKDTEGTTEESVSIYDTPKKPVVAPRTRANLSSNSTNEDESKPLVPPKRIRTSTQVSSIIGSLNSNAHNPKEQDLKSDAVKSGLPTVSPKPTNTKPKPPLPKPFGSPANTAPISESKSAQTTSIDTTELYDDPGSRYIVAQKPKAEEKALPDEMPDYAEPDTLVMKPASTAPSVTSTDINKYKITSKPYELEEFAAEFPLPQIIRVYSGYYGITEQFSMSEGEELILFFIKSSKIITASTRSKAETYHLPLNTSVQFSPYQQKSLEKEEQTYRYKTVGDLIQRDESLPKVVKVFRSFAGVSEESSVSAGDLIFPRKVSGKKKKTVLKCTNKSGQKLKLGLNCVGDFSVDPSDVRMYLLEYIEYINEFPYTAMIFNDNDESGKLSCLRTGTVLVLDSPQPLRSYICSTDIFGEKDYPIVELPMIMPIQIQCMERPELNMEPIYNKVQHAYENFKPSMIKKSLYPAQNQTELKAQQQFYEEVQKDDGSSHLYDLERPEAIYEAIPGENAFYVRKAEAMRLPPSLPPLKSSAPSTAPGATVTSPPVSGVKSPKSPAPPKPVRHQSLHEFSLNKLPPSVPASPLAKSGTVPPAVPSKPVPIGNKEPTYDALVDPTQSTVPPSPVAKPSTVLPAIPSKPVPIGNKELTYDALVDSTQSTVPPSPVAKPSTVLPAIPSKPVPIGNKEPTYETLEEPTQPMVPPATPTFETTPEENIAYLKTMDVETVLQLLGDMNLAEYKDSFRHEQVDGELLVDLTKNELEDLGITKKIHQLRLMKLIDGSSSAKKYEGGIYGTLS